MAFKTRIRHIKNTVKKSSEEWLKIKEKGRINHLEKERDFFKNEAFRFDKL
jgi:hypothetical protein